MKRVQMILEEWQHEWLSEEASDRGMTMSALLRQLLDEGINRQNLLTTYIPASPAPSNRRPKGMADAETVRNFESYWTNLNVNRPNFAANAELSAR